MAQGFAIVGSAVETGERLSIEETVFSVVNAALASAGTPLSAIDFVVTVGSDTLDAAMVATRSGIAGSYGRQLMTVPSSAGHAFGAALALLESGQAERLLLAGWGEGTKFGDLDGRGLQADPFYERPVGGDAVHLAALQAQRLAADGRLAPDALAAYGREMCRRAGVVAAKDAAMAAWLKPFWADGAGALVLTASRQGAGIAGWGRSFRAYAPEGEDLDPAGWVAQALSDAGVSSRAFGAVEITAPTMSTEYAALGAVLPASQQPGSAASVNAKGSGAARYFGPATGLLSLAAAAQAAPASGSALALDLAGPIGQATVAVLLEGGAR